MRDNPSSRVASGRMALIDCCRGVAALLVVVHHGIYFVAGDASFATDPLQGWFRFGCRGVDFFFVLSGFIIAYAHWADLGRADRIYPYLAKRFIRIYPILWVVGVPCILINLANASVDMPSGGVERAEVVAGSLALAPTPWPTIPVVAWTLRHEVLFYLLYAVLLWRPRIGAGAFALWGGLCVYHSSWGCGSNFLSDFLLSPYNLEFLLGVCCGWLVRAKTVRFPLLLSLIGAMLFMVAGMNFEPTTDSRDWITNPTTFGQVAQFGLSSALIIVGLSQLDLRETLAPPRWLTLLGAASYSIYLVHFGAMRMACTALSNATDRFSITPLMAFIAIVLVGVIEGIAIHLYVEVPLLRFVRRMLLSPQSRVVPSRVTYCQT